MRTVGSHVVTGLYQIVRFSLTVLWSISRLTLYVFAALVGILIGLR